MFSRLDTNFDLQLDQSEIKSLYLDRNEPCSDAFFKSCDVHIDKVLTSTEWCTCFQRYTGTMSQSVNDSTLERSSVENLASPLDGRTLHTVPLKPMLHGNPPQQVVRLLR